MQAGSAAEGPPLKSGARGVMGAVCTINEELRWPALRAFSGATAHMLVEHFDSNGDAFFPVLKSR